MNNDLDSIFSILTEFYNHGIKCLDIHIKILDENKITLFNELTNKLIDDEMLFNEINILIFKNNLKNNTATRLLNVVTKYGGFSKILIYNEKKFIIKTESSKYRDISIIHINKSFNFLKSTVNPSTLLVNPKKYTEELQFNTYLNGKIYIDSEGNVKNSPQSTETIGNIYNKPIESILTQSNFDKSVLVTKDQIDVCKDCELKFMCSNNAKTYKRLNSTYYHKIECNYNPYISKWKEEEGFLDLNNCGVVVTEFFFKINVKKIKEINNLLWELKDI